MTYGPDSDLLKIITQFNIQSDLLEYVPYGKGHINDTFRVYVDDPNHPGYLLQRINDQVFPDAEALMNNIQKVIRHLKEARPSEEGRVLTLIHTKDEDLFLKTDSGCWRMFLFLDSTKSFDKTKNAEQAYQAAIAYGKFIHDLSDLPVASLKTIIPDFHNMSFRLRQLDEAVESADSGRLERVEHLLQTVSEHREKLDRIYKDAAGGMLPLRITHNDTKLNNLLFHENSGAVSVVDPDTVMPGYLFYDLGDGIRSSVTLADEDEKDLSAVRIDTQKYDAYLKGYVEATKSILTKAELNSFTDAGQYMAFIMGIRFLADYLNGDTYYKTSYPEQNMYRARCQLHVSVLLDKQRDRVEKYLSDLSVMLG